MGVILSFTFIAILRHLPIAHHDEEHILCVNALKLIEYTQRLNMVLMCKRLFIVITPFGRTCAKPMFKITTENGEFCITEL